MLAQAFQQKKSITKLIFIIQQKDKHQDLSLNLQRKMLNMKRLMKFDQSSIVVDFVAGISI
jgi:hypothetical protein